ncbi:UDP-N-acetylmuramate dehydrogenase [Brochothrix thermosphacta]|uniref:UDP-N-acetylmuramate dehydrogenase n=1 Tax=Brochothrix thermosphacta TaxID=2756 RepID=UPI000D7A3980|nr:UDP-N-acetylmuramate dehydrogenase [Brochothrix thermosphacta]SPN76202.1 UDP-N-acetylenolpyruvoylglucosamine reductase [Brochothrix thermosphacta]
MINKIATELQDLSHSLLVKTNEPLNKYTYTKTGGPADVFAVPQTIEEAQIVVTYAYKNDIPLMVLGNGSNLIIRDGGIRGIVLYLMNLTEITYKNNTLTAQTGSAIIDVSREAHKLSLAGLEFACGIPGSVGGALHMNAGAYGGETKDVLNRALVLTASGELIELDRQTLEEGASYRHSIIADKNYIVLEADFLLTPDAEETIAAKMANFTEQRESRQPLEYPSCGSVFKRPEGRFVGPMIQEAGLQGHTIGGVQVSLKHAGFMVNINQGTATDYIDLIAHVQKVIHQNYNVKLEPEVKILGEEVEV